MRIGVPREIKVHEYRVGLIPSSVRERVHSGHEGVVQKGAGVGAGLSDEAYRLAGARVVDTAEEVFVIADMLVQGKKPQGTDSKKVRAGRVLFTYLHLAPDPEQTRDLQGSRATCIAYETVTAPDGTL